ncbi:MAG TPA: MFS transporter [Solirubrobacterales bacterium]
MATALSLLRSQPRFRALWLAIAISYTGSGATQTALTLYVAEQQGTGVAVGALVLAMSLPQLLGPLTGALADRVELRRAMVLCDLAQAACFALLATLPPLGPLLGLVAVTAALQTIYGPARSTAIPALVEEDQLLAANATLGIAHNFNIVVGPPLGGALFALFGPASVLWLNAASFLVSALLTTRLPLLLPSGAGETPERIWASIRSGLRYVAGNQLIRTVLLALFFVVAFVAFDEVALVFLVRDTLGGSSTVFGFVTAAFGIGMLAGSLGILARLHVPPPRFFLAGLTLIALGTLLTGLAPLIVFAALFQMIAGGGNGVMNGAGDTIIQRYVPRKMVGRVFGIGVAAFALGLGLAAPVGGALVDATSPRTTFVIAGSGALFVAALAAPVLRRAA